MHEVALTHDTALRSAFRLGLGLDERDQVEPFQDSTSAPVASCGPLQVPTAAQKLLLTQETPDSSSPVPTLGLGVVDHSVPFQVSTKVPDSSPTAAQKAALEHETPSKDALLLRLGEEA